MLYRKKNIAANEREPATSIPISCKVEKPARDPHRTDRLRCAANCVQRTHMILCGYDTATGSRLGVGAVVAWLE